MTHYSRLSAVVVDVPAADHDREIAFWQAASGTALDSLAHLPEYRRGTWPGHQVYLVTQQMGGGQARVHLDIRADDVPAEVARLERLGAERVSQVHYWHVLRDPAGLPFCVVPAEPGTLTDHNSQRWF